MIIKKWFVSILLLVSPQLFAASSQFLNVESFYVKPDVIPKVLTYAVNVASNRSPFKRDSIKYLAKLDSDIVYVAKVKVNNVLYYRLVSGNFATLALAKKHLAHVKKYYPDAWLNIRRIQEKQELSDLLSPTPTRKLKAVTLPPLLAPVVIPEVAPIEISRIEPQVAPQTSAKAITNVEPKPFPKLSPQVTPQVTSSIATNVISKKTESDIPLEPEKPVEPEKDFAEKLLDQAKQLFLDKNYARVITVSEKVIEIGSIDQKQRAMEFVGIARERQRKFAQAVAIYAEFLDLYPDSKLAPKIQMRLTGLTTMRDDPKSLIVKKKPEDAVDNWDMYGSLSQYYRNDFVEIDTLDTQELNSSLVTDVN